MLFRGYEISICQVSPAVGVHRGDVPFWDVVVFPGGAAELVGVGVGAGIGDEPDDELDEMLDEMLDEALGEEIELEDEDVGEA